jgi:hypothetical protein
MRIFVTLAVFAAVLLAGCGEGVSVVESGTYEGTVAEAVPEEEEIYVDLENGETIELYFNEETKLTRDDEAAEFSELSEGTRVRVEVERVGNRLEPRAVEILE